MYPDYTGVHCELKLSSCRASPCQNHGTCIDQATNYTCICPAGLSGTHCEVQLGNVVVILFSCFYIVSSVIVVFAVADDAGFAVVVVAMILDGYMHYFKLYLHIF